MTNHSTSLDADPNAMPPQQIVDMLLDLLRELSEESADDLLLEHDQQRWYNQGYARGMSTALRELGAGEQVAAILCRDFDDPPGPDNAGMLPWEKALAHGYRMGYQETQQIWLHPPEI